MELNQNNFMSLIVKISDFYVYIVKYRFHPFRISAFKAFALILKGA
jgi:hypothetical protein